MSAEGRLRRVVRSVSALGALAAEGSTPWGYAQARIQARHGQRPSEATWRSLRRSLDLAHALMTARSSELAPWVVGLDERSASGDVERALRNRLRLYVEEVASWVPRPWRAQVHWTRWWPYLPLLDRAANAPSEHPTLADDPIVAPFALAQPLEQARAFASAGLGELLDAARRGEDMRAAWARVWKALGPEGDSLRPLIEVVRKHARALDEADGDADASRLTSTLEHELTRLFRRYALHPLGAWSHLACIDLDVRRLRGALTRRALLPHVRSEGSWD